MPHAFDSTTSSLDFSINNFEYPFPLFLTSTYKSFNNQYLLTLVDENIGYNCTKPDNSLLKSQTNI